MNAPTNILAANRAETEARWTAEIAAIGKAATALAEVRAENRRPTDSVLLWAEYEFAKALDAHLSVQETHDMLADARNELGLDGDACDRHDGDYRYDLARENAA